MSTLAVVRSGGLRWTLGPPRARACSPCSEYHYGQSRVEPAVRKQSAGGPQQPNIGQRLSTVFPRLRRQIADIGLGRDTPWPLSGLQASSSVISSSSPSCAQGHGLIGVGQKPVCAPIELISAFDLGSPV